MYFCLFCLAGKEQFVRDVSELYLTANIKEDFCVWFPLREMYERKKGEERKVFHPLLPSYVFIYWNGEDERCFPFRELCSFDGAVRFLRYQNSSRILTGKDLEYVRWIHKNSGQIRISQAEFLPNQRIHFVQGALKGKDGDVVKVDRHHKRVTVRFNIEGKDTFVTFSVDFLQSNKDIQTIASPASDPYKIFGV